MKLQHDVQKVLLYLSVKWLRLPKTPSARSPLQYTGRFNSDLGSWSRFPVSDHNFTVFSTISSVSLLIDVPEDIYGSWYAGQVHIGLKDGAL